MSSLFIILLLILILTIFGVSEYFRHQRIVYQIPIRIHINGTRGKSSVTRLVGAGLRAGGINTITKVTGTYPRLILNDGSEAIIHRKEKANILEQLKIIKYAFNHKADAIVIECMALQPLYQIVTERQMVHATIGVITNVRLDHLDVMGPGLKEVADALSKTIPENEYFFTAENRIYSYLEEIAIKKNCIPFRSDENIITDEEMTGFAYMEHKENVALALAVCAHIGIDRKIALTGMYSAIPDEGVLTKALIKKENKSIHFYNAFAANDPESSLMIWNNIMAKTLPGHLHIVLLNTREDRLDRARQLVEMAGELTTMDYLIMIGQRCEIVHDMAIKNRIPVEKLVKIGWSRPENVFWKIFSLVHSAAVVVAIGNMGGMGADVAKYFELISNKELYD